MVLGCFVVASTTIEDATESYVTDSGSGEVVSDSSQAVVKIGSTYYSSFKAAVDAAGKSGTIEFVKDVYFTSTDTASAIQYDVSGLKIDLCEHTIKVDKLAMNLIGQGFELTNGEIVGGDNGTYPDSGYVSYPLFIGDRADKDVTTSNVTLSNLTITGGVNVYKSTGVILKDLTVNATNYYAAWCEDSTLTIESGEYTIGTTKYATAVIGAEKKNSNEGNVSLTVKDGWGR